MKAKHNKKRNTAFLYDVLVKELTKSIMNKHGSRRQMVSSILKEGFSKDTILGKDLECYGVLLETTELAPHLAEKLLYETKATRAKLDSKEIFDSQTQIINKINSTLSKEAWNTFVPNFKSLATISTIFNDQTSPKQRVLYEDTVIQSMSSKKTLQEEKMQPIDNIIYQSFVKKYNEEYSNLLGEQKNLLNKYISSFSDNELELKLYLNEEVGRLKNAVQASLKSEDIASDVSMFERAKEVVNLLESYKDAQPSQEMVSKILKIQNLVREINSDD